MGLTAHEDCVVIVIDAQPGFHPPDLADADHAAAAQALDRAAWLVALATRLEIPVVVTEEEPEVNGPTDPRLAAAPAFVKPTFGLAGTPAILEAVLQTGRTTAILVGFETDVCVAQSAIGLVDLAFRAVVPEDAVYTNSAVEHERGLVRMTGAGVERNHCKGLTFEWLHTVDRALETFPEAAALGTPPWRL